MTCTHREDAQPRQLVDGGRRNTGHARRSRRAVGPGGRPTSALPAIGGPGAPRPAASD